MSKVFLALQDVDESRIIVEAIEKDNPEKKAKHYYNLGLAYKGKGDKNAACSAFKNALYGQFKENAQFEIDNELKCNK
jgi:hypothetical protein